MALSAPLRLQKYLAACGLASRRGAEALIRAGRITVDGVTVTEMGRKIDPATESVCCDGKTVAPDSEPPVYILLNKPKGYLTTVSDPQGRPVVTGLLENVSTRVYPVGRLDLNTEGALLLTNDGELAHRILHPRFETNKTYEAVVRGVPNRDALNRLRNGILLEGSKTSPAELTRLERKKNSSRIKIIIHEGRKRQVRKMFQAIGHPVLELKRTAYGRLQLGNLPTGSYRFLKARDLKKIFL